MCIAVPGKLIEIDGRRGKADVRGTVLTVELGLVDAKLGDYILVHAGCAISVVSKEDSDELSELLELIQYGEH